MFFVFIIFYLLGVNVIEIVDRMYLLFFYFNYKLILFFVFRKYRKMVNIDIDFKYRVQILLFLYVFRRIMCVISLMINIVCKSYYKFLINYRKLVNIVNEDFNILQKGRI